MKKMIFIILLFASFLFSQTSYDVEYVGNQNGYVDFTSTIAVGDSVAEIIVKKESDKPGTGYCTLAGSFTGDSTITASWANWWDNSIGSETSYSALTGTVTATSTATIKSWNIGTQTGFSDEADGYYFRFEIPSNTDTAQVITGRVKLK